MHPSGWSKRHRGSSPCRKSVHVNSAKASCKSLFASTANNLLLSPHFLRFPNGKILLAARYFVRLAYGNACYAGNHLDYSVSFAIIFSPYLVDIISLFAAFINTKPSPCPLPREISICLTACFTLWKTRGCPRPKPTWRTSKSWFQSSSTSQNSSRTTKNLNLAPSRTEFIRLHRKVWACDCILCTAVKHRNSAHFPVFVGWNVLRIWRVILIVRLMFFVLARSVFTG